MPKILPNLTLDLSKYTSARDAIAAIQRFAVEQQLAEKAAAEDAVEKAERRKAFTADVERFEAAVAVATADLNRAKAALAAFDGKPPAKPARTRVGNGERAVQAAAMLTAAQNGTRPVWEPAPESNASRNKTAGKYDAAVNDCGPVAALVVLRSMRRPEGSDTYGVRLAAYYDAMLAYCEHMANPPAAEQLLPIAA